MYKMKWIEYRFDTLPSTQDFLREKRAEGKFAIAVAACQTAGKGTKGRSFESQEGGLWLSALLFHEEVQAKDAFLMMARSAVAVCKTLEEYGLAPKIKWANDVLLKGKKVCGVLTENVCSGNRLQSTLFGIGLNVNNVLGEEISSIATTMSKELGATLSLQEVEQRFLSHFFAPVDFSEYTNRLAYLGEEVPFVCEGRNFTATLCGVTETGELLLLENGEKRRYSHGEIAMAKLRGNE